MKKMAVFLRTTLLGGFIVLLPVVLTIFLIRWLVALVSQAIEPLTLVFTEHARLGHAFALSFALVGVISLCFVLGLVVKTRLGHGLLKFVEQSILKVAPGYTFFKETVGQLLGQKSRPFSRVVLVRMFGSSTYSTGFVTNEHAPSGLVTVFVPSGLNPMSGLLLHLPSAELIYVNVSVETAMRTIIGCGTGASLMLDGAMGEATPAVVDAPG
jgi:uncharacterized membrane protein